MLNSITFYPIFGKPLIMYGGIVVAILFLIGAYYGSMALKGNAKTSTHMLIVKIALVLGLIHGVLGILSFF